MADPIPGAAGPGAPFPQWAVVAGSPGQHVTKIANALAKGLIETVSFPAKVIFFTSQQAADNWVSSNGGQAYLPGTKAPLNAANNAINTATAAPQGLNAIGAFFARLGQASLWLRIAEVALGLVLVAVGVAKIVPAFTPAQAIAKQAGVKL